jgi:hypothetical protein
VDLVGNLSIQRYPDIVNFDLIQLLGLQRSDVNITLTDVVDTYHGTISVIGLKTTANETSDAARRISTCFSRRPRREIDRLWGTRS